MNEYAPWLERDQTELEYFKERYLQARVRESALEHALERILRSKCIMTESRAIGKNGCHCAACIAYAALKANALEHSLAMTQFKR